MRYSFAFLAVSALVCLSATQSRADEITYSEQAIASGSLGGNSFTNAEITVTGTGNTSTIFNIGLTIFVEDLGPTTIDVAGLGTATFTDQITVFDNIGTEAAGITDPLVEDILDTFDPAFATYELTTAIGPITGGPISHNGFLYPTTAGDLSITGTGNSTFTATLDSSATGTPEPGTIGWLGATLTSLGLFARRRMRKQ